MSLDFDKYRKQGALHWNATNKLHYKYQPALVARYDSVINHMPNGSKNIVDIGCGDGRLTYLLASKLPKAHVLGIDSDPTGIEIARQRVAQHSRQDIKFIVNTEDGLPGAAEKYDLVVMTDVIEHLPSPSSMMDEIARVLTDNGTAIITTPNRQEGRKWDERHVHEFDGPELVSLMKEYFHDVRLFGSWPMEVCRWASGTFNRTVVKVTSRFGSNPFSKEKENPDSEWGQLLALCSRPRRA